MSLLINEPK